MSATPEPRPARAGGGAGGLNLALKFLLELAAFAALAWTGWDLGHHAGGGAGVVLGIALAVVLVAIAVAVWGRWCAPRSTQRLPTRARVPLELVVFAAAAVGLLITGAVVLAVVFAALVIVNAILLTVLRQWDG